MDVWNEEDKCLLHKICDQGELFILQNPLIQLVKHGDGKVDLGKLLCSGGQHQRLSLQNSLVEREVPRKQSTMTAVSVLLIVIICTGAIHPCELILEVVLLPSTLCIHFP